MDVVERYRRASAAFGRQVHAVGTSDWHRPTPCAEWDVRDLVNHLVGENRWAVELFAGRRIADVGDRFDGDVLGPDPVESWDSSSSAASAAVGEPGAMDRTVHLSFGDVPGAEYTEQLAADLLVHGWDLARALGRDPDLEPELVAACAAWFARWEEGYRAAGAIGPRQDADPGDEGARLVASFGRDPAWTPPSP